MVVCGWVSKLRGRFFFFFFGGNSKQNKICYNLVPFYSSTKATKPDSISNKKNRYADNRIFLAWTEKLLCLWKTYNRFAAVSEKSISKMMGKFSKIPAKELNFLFKLHTVLFNFTENKLQHRYFSWISQITSTFTVIPRV